VLGHEGIVGNETADQLARTGSEHPFTGPEPACGISVGVAKKAPGTGQTEIKKKPFGIRNWTQTGKGSYTRAFCEKNDGSVKIKQRPVKMGDRTIYRTLSSKGHLLKVGLTDDPTCERCLGKDESATYILCDCEARFLRNQVTTMTPP
jgi:hypothetical protein